MKIGGLVVAVALVFGAVLMNADAAQQTPGGVSVEVNGGTGPPGGRASMPISLTAPDTLKVGKIELTLTYDASLLSFDGSELGNLGGVDAQFTTKEAPGKAGESQLQVTLSTIDGQGDRKPIPPGRVAYLLFKVAQTAKMDTSIPVDANGRAMTVDTPPKPVEPIAVQGSSVDVANPPVSSCFFYMH